MKQAQITIKEILGIFRRRKKFLILPPIIITIIAAVSALMMPNEYESYTTILVGQEQILNPLISFQMAVAMASEDRLRTFNEIIYSHTMMVKLRDSVFRQDDSLNSVGDDQSVTTKLRSAIRTERRGSESFRISFGWTDPEKARDAVGFLADEFIRTILQVEGQRNEEAVNFFQAKHDELKEKYEAAQNDFIRRLQSQNDIPLQDIQNLLLQMDKVQGELSGIDTRIRSYNLTLENLDRFPAALGTEQGRQILDQIALADVPFADELKAQLTIYDDLTRKYKGKYPDVVRMETRLTDLLTRIRKAIESEIRKQDPDRWALEQQREQIVEEMRRYSISEKIDSDTESDYGIYKRLYNEMKVKLEQAKTTRDLGRTASNQFIIIDPALVPNKPTKPNRRLLVLGGFVVGLCIGFASVLLAELFDTTIRTSKDIEVYQKPIIAFIIEGDENRRM